MGACLCAIKVDDAHALAHLTALDDRGLRAVLLSGAIKLLSPSWLVSQQSSDLTRLPRRQELEEREQNTGETIFVPPAEAVAMLSAGRREIGALTYGWTTMDHPDEEGVYLAAVRRALRSGLCAHIKALFWDFASLLQKPRSKDGDVLFGQALNVMGDVYASAVGVSVLRHRLV